MEKGMEDILRRNFYFFEENEKLQAHEIQSLFCAKEQKKIVKKMLKNGILKKEANGCISIDKKGNNLG